MNRDVFWSALEASGAALFSVAAAFLIARLIGPAELGIGATAAAVHVLLWVGVNALFADAIVQRGSIDDTILASAIWASTAVGCAAAGLQAGSGWLLAWMLDDPRLVPMALLLALPFPFVGLGGALQGLLTRQRRYRALAARTLAGQGAGMAIGVALALGRAARYTLLAYMGHRYGRHIVRWLSRYYQPLLYILIALAVAGALAAIYYWRRQRQKLQSDSDSSPVKNVA